MAVQMGIWRVEGKTLKPVVSSVVGLEQQLEGYIESDPTILGQPLLILGRQVQTVSGPLDLLAMDSTGAVHVIELKRDKTPRDVAAQVLDYGSWVAGLSHEDVLDLFAKRSPNVEFDQAFADLFGEGPPEDLNTEQVFTIVATALDPATERIVRFLSESFAVPINAVFFRHFEDGSNSYLARTWLVEQEVIAAASGTKKRSSREPWNGRDWGVTFGTGGARAWQDAMKYGFVSAGGGRWYSQTLRNLPVGARVFVSIPGSGYVGVGEVLAGAQRFDAVTVEVDGEERLLSSLPLNETYRHDGDESDHKAEWVVPVQWEVTRPESQAFWVKGMRANQNSAFKMYQSFTIDQVTAEFGLEP
jgi:hypothetical protein